MSDETRCAVCGWPLSTTPDEGCTRGNCSMRPLPRRYADYERAKREYAPAVLPEPEPPSPLEADLATLRQQLAEALGQLRIAKALTIHHANGEVVTQGSFNALNAAYYSANAKLAATEKQLEEAKDEWNKWVKRNSTWIAEVIVYQKERDDANAKLAAASIREATLREAIEKRLHETEAIGDVPQAIGERYGYEWVLSLLVAAPDDGVVIRGLRELQAEQVPWVKHNFGDRPSWMPLLGAVEELGELAHAHLKQAQGIRVSEDHDAKAKDAVADVVIYLADYCTARGFDLQSLVLETWDRVKQRDWKAHPSDADALLREMGVSR